MLSVFGVKVVGEATFSDNHNSQPERPPGGSPRLAAGRGTTLTSRQTAGIPTTPIHPTESAMNRFLRRAGVFLLAFVVALLLVVGCRHIQHAVEPW